MSGILISKAKLAQLSKTQHFSFRNVLQITSFVQEPVKMRNYSGDNSFGALLKNCLVVSFSLTDHEKFVSTELRTKLIRVDESFSRRFFYLTTWLSDDANWVNR